jgi:chromosome segregation protein
VIEAERKLAGRASSCALERQAQEAQFQAARWPAPRRAAARHRNRAAADPRQHASGEQLQLELDSFNDAAAQAGLQEALAVRAERRGPGRRAAATTT